MHSIIAANTHPCPGPNVPKSFTGLPFWSSLPPGTILAKVGTQSMTNVYMAPSKKDWMRPIRKTCIRAPSVVKI